MEKCRLSCRDIGIDDDFVSSGKSRADVVSKMARYAFRVHGIDSRRLKMDSAKRAIRC